VGLGGMGIRKKNKERDEERITSKKEANHNNRTKKIKQNTMKEIPFRRKQSTLREEKGKFLEEKRKRQMNQSNLRSEPKKTSPFSLNRSFFLKG
jgi:hypothetical protein